MLVPHLGSATTETRTAMANLAVDNVAAVLAGRPPLTPVLGCKLPPSAERRSRCMRTLARAIDGLELPAVEKISRSQEDDPFQVLIATMLSARTQDATTLAASTRLFKAARTPRTMADADRQADRAADLSGQLLPSQGPSREGDLPSPGRALRRPGADDDGGVVDAAGRGAENGESGADPWIREREEHLCRHPRPPDFESARVGRDAHAG